MNKRRRLLIAAQIVISALLIGYLLTRIDLHRLVAVWSTIRLPFVVLALALQCLGVMISSWKWWSLLRVRGHAVPYWWAVRAYFIGQFFSNFLPTSIGGDAVRIYLASRRTGAPAVAIASVFVERLTGFCALTAIAWVALAFSGDALVGLPVCAGRSPARSPPRQQRWSSRSLHR